MDPSNEEYVIKEEDSIQEGFDKNENVIQISESDDENELNSSDSFQISRKTIENNIAHLNRQSYNKNNLSENEIDSESENNEITTTVLDYNVLTKKIHALTLQVNQQTLLNAQLQYENKTLEKEKDKLKEHLNNVISKVSSTPSENLRTYNKDGYRENANQDWNLEQQVKRETSIVNNENFSSSALHQQMQQQIIQQKRNITQLNAHNKSLIEEIQRLKAQSDRDTLSITQLHSGLQQKETEIDQLKALVTQLDLTRETLQENIRDIQNNQNKDSVTFKNQLQRISELERSHGQLESQLTSSRKIIKQMDEDKDNLLAELDKKDEQISQLIVKCTGLEDENKRQKIALNDANERAEHQMQMLENKEQYYIQMRDKIDNLTNENKQLRQNEKETQDEFYQISQDLKHMSQEHQFLSHELERFRHENEKLTRQYQECIATTQQNDQTFKIKDQEINDLLHAYKQVCFEQERSQEQIMHMEHELEDLKNEYTRRMEELEHIHQQAQHLNEENQRQIIDIQSLQSENEQLNFKLVRIQNDNAALQEERNQLLENISSQRFQGIDLQQNIGLLERDILALRAQNERMEAELVETRKIIHQQEVKSDSLQEIITELRFQEVQLQGTIKQYEKTSKISNEREDALERQLQAKEDSISKLKKQLDQYASNLQKKDLDSLSDSNIHLKLRQRESTLQSQVNELNQKIHTIEKKLQESQYENERLRDLVNKLDSDREALQREYDVLLTQLENEDSRAIW